MNIVRFVVSMMAVSCAAMFVSACASSQGETVAMSGAFADSELIALKVDGMACRNCANEIARELKEVPGVKDAVVDFDRKQAIVALDDNHPASAADLNAAVEHWRVEHFGLEEDPDCLDPQKREQIKRENAAKTGG